MQYARGTGEVMEISDTLDSGGLREGEALPDTRLEEIALHTLAAHYGVSAALCEKDDGGNAYRWIGRFAAASGEFEVCLDRQTGGVIRVTQYMTQSVKEETE